MAVSNYKSFEANELHMKERDEETAGLITADVTETTDIDVNPTARVHHNRNRLISVVSLVLAVVGVTLLASFSKGSYSKSSLSSISKPSDMHSFESITAGVMNADKTAQVLARASRPTKAPVERTRPTAAPNKYNSVSPHKSHRPKPTNAPVTGKPVEEHKMSAKVKPSRAPVERVRPSAKPNSYNSDMPHKSHRPKPTVAPVEERKLSKTTPTKAPVERTRPTPAPNSYNSVSPHKSHRPKPTKTPVEQVTPRVVKKGDHVPPANKDGSERVHILQNLRSQDIKLAQGPAKGPKKNSKKQ